MSEQLLSPKLENIISGHNINQDDADWLRAALTQPAEGGEVVAWSVFDKRTGKHWYTHESKSTAQYYAKEYSHRESDGSPSMVVKPLYTTPPASQEQEQQPAACDGGTCGIGGYCKDCTQVDDTNVAESFTNDTKPQAQAQELQSSEFDLICQAIDKADTITMDGDYMLDSNDCIKVVRVMQALLDITRPASATQAQAQELPDELASQILDSWMRECNVYCVTKMGHEWASQTKRDDLLYLVKSAALAAKQEREPMTTDREARQSAQAQNDELKAECIKLTSKLSNAMGTRKVLWNLLGEALPLLHQIDCNDGESEERLNHLIQRIEDARSVVQAEELPCRTESLT